MGWQQRIESDREICGGRPHIRGTRLTAEFLLGLKAAGWSEAQILDAYPHITAEDIQAVFAFALALVQENECLGLPKLI